MGVAAARAAVVAANGEGVSPGRWVRHKQGRSMRKLAEKMGAFAGARPLTARPGDTKLARRH
eukprot:7376638-Prymnesium_polylepis.1